MRPVEARLLTQLYINNDLSYTQASALSLQIELYLVRVFFTSGV